MFFFKGFCKIAACVNLGVTLKGLNLVNLMLSLDWNLKYRFSQLFHRSEDRFEKAHHPCCSVSLAQLEEVGQAILPLQIFQKLSRNIFFKPAWLKPSSLGRTSVCSQPTIILGNSFQINQQLTKRSFCSLFVLFKKKSVCPGYICLARVKICNLSRGFLNSTKK